MFKRSEFLKFLLTSGLATAVNIVARVLLSTFFMYEVAVIVAHIIGMGVAFLLARKYVFQPSGRALHYEMLGFCAVNVISLIQVWTISVGLYRLGLPLIGWTYQTELIAHVCGVGSLIFTSYFGHKYVSFRKTACR